jgi:large subunit ribosomal protein L31
MLYLCTLKLIKAPTANYNIYKRLNNMKKDIHPSDYRPVVFKDMSNDEIFISRSTVNARETIEVDGVTYPLVKLEITSASHPFYTGKQTLVDTAGRVDKFMSRYGDRKKK